MPNGGVPINMLMRPSSGDSHVIFCHGATMKVISNEEWEKSKRDGEPSLTLDEAEERVLERFLRYWLGDVDDGPIYRPQGANVVYDY